MNSAWTKTDLRYFKTPTFAKQNIIFRHPYISKFHVHMTTRGMVVTEHLHRVKNLNPRGIYWNQNL